MQVSPQTFWGYYFLVIAKQCLLSPVPPSINLFMCVCHRPAQEHSLQVPFVLCCSQQPLYDPQASIMALNGMSLHGLSWHECNTSQEI